MEETRRIPIDNKVLKKKDLVRLWKVFDMEYRKIAKKQLANSTVKVCIHCTDNSSYEFNSIAEDGILDIKRTDVVQMTYNNQNKGYINLSLTQGTSSYGNRLEIKGRDKKWVRSLEKDFEEKIEAITPQSHWLTKYKWPLRILIWIFLTFLLFYICTWIVLYPEIMAATTTGNNSSKPLTYEDIRVLVLFLWPFGIIAAVITHCLYDWVIKLWPSIEFDFGPEHKKIEKKKRLRILAFFSPIGLDILLFVFKQLTN